jgi:4-amino-4-deoxy-L-arabinose transferase-like glycosyltransferase
MLKIKPGWWLILILLLATGLRLWGVTKADVITDEALIAFRSIGLIDFFASPDQTTPWEWFSGNLPSWVKLSFHDHPPLVFWIQHFFFSIFGVNLLVLRLPFVLAGVLSVYLIYLIGRKLFDERVGFFGALFLTICTYHVWISRIGLQESFVILFSLLAIYLFFIALNKENFWFLWGIVLGLAFLLKYTTFFLPLVFIIYILIYQRKVFYNYKFYLALFLAGLVFSPVLIYNLKLFMATGHFDLQFSYFFGQKVVAWQNLPGKEQIGSFGQRIIGFPQSLVNNLSVLELVLFITSLISLFYSWIKENSKSLSFLLILTLGQILFFLLVGSSPRFIVAVIPYLALIAGWSLSRLNIFRFKLRWVIFIVFIIAELFFCYNSLIADYPIGPKFLYSQVRKESYLWGYNQLDNYLDNLLRDKKPALTLQTNHPFLEEIKSQVLRQDKIKHKIPAAILLIYDANINSLASLWIFHRRLVYQGWPTVSAETYINQGQDFFKNLGFKNFYFIKIKDQHILQQPEAYQATAASELVSELGNISADIIKRPDGREVFSVYTWEN